MAPQPPQRVRALSSQPPVPTHSPKTLTFSYALTVPASTAVNQEANQQKRMPVDGRIGQIVLFFPAGSQGTTGVFFTREGQTVFPYEEGTSIALDNATVPFQTDIEIHRGDVLQFNGNNSDTVSHTIRAIVTLHTTEEAPVGFG